MIICIHCKNWFIASPLNVYSNQMLDSPQYWHVDVLDYWDQLSLIKCDKPSQNVVKWQIIGRSSDISFHRQWLLHVIKAHKEREKKCVPLFWPCFSDLYRISMSRTVKGFESRSHFIWKCGLALSSIVVCFPTSPWWCAFSVSHSLVLLFLALP